MVSNGSSDRSGGGAPRVVLYSRPGCHLCEVARDVVLDVRSRVAFEFEEVDVEGDDALELEYGIRVPVVTVDGDERFEVTVDAGELVRVLGASGGDPRS
jgi:glutaredoxin